MATGILHLHLLLALIFLIAVAKASGVWAKMAAAVGALLLLSGLYNFMTRMPGAPAGWHIVIGVKILAGLHAITLAFLIAFGADAVKIARWRKSALGSAFFASGVGLYYLITRGVN